jgi:hypothetical protein
MVVLALLGAIGCATEEAGPEVSRSPASIRGWVGDIELPPNETYRLMEQTTGINALKLQILQDTTLSVAGTQVASGGMAENGSFIILDVAPGTVTIIFSAPGLPENMLKIDGVPGNADILLPAVELTMSGAKVDPKKVVARIPEERGTTTPVPPPISVMGVQVPVQVVSLNALVDRRDYPEPKRDE